ncbi:hypothetical protein [Gimesia panareensis]|uniref:hypothetical protein n=1 Tax=Gimesia panareensis TaxID=2527978 RepID=UPI00118CFD0E|nr:hypothetical protein [Gimesia panareensis]QDU50381.1 hypothetical protein Pan110_27270 [Gimesia panareensis]
MEDEIEFEDELEFEDENQIEEIDQSGLDAAAHDVKQASIAAFISAGMSFLVILFAMFSGRGGALEQFADPLNFIEVALVLACGIGLRFYSRTAAVTLVIYFILAKLYTMMTLGRPTGLLFTVIWLYFYWKGIRGSFAYHRIRREADPTYRSTPLLFIALVIPSVAIMLGLVVLGVMVESGTMVSPEVVAGSELSQSDSQMLVDEGIIAPDETVLYFYSTGVTSISDDGNLLTDQRVISYERVDGVLGVYAAKYEEVEDVITVEEGNYIDDTIVEIDTVDGELFFLYLSPIEGGDQTFIKELQSRIPAKPKQPELPKL